MENKKLLQKISNEMNTNTNDNINCEHNTFFDLASFVYSFDCKEDFKCSEVFSKYDRLCKKVDVVGILYTHYTFCLSKKKSDEMLTEIQLERFTLNLMFLAIHRHDLKFVNTLLKLVDSSILKIDERIASLILECKERVFTYYE